MRKKIFVLLTSAMFTNSSLIAMMLSDVEESNSNLKEIKTTVINAREILRPEDCIEGLGAFHVLPSEQIVDILRKSSNISVKNLYSLLLVSKQISFHCQNLEIWQMIAKSNSIRITPESPVAAQIYSYYGKLDKQFDDPTKNYPMSMKLFKKFIFKQLPKGFLSRIKLETTIGGDNFILEDIGKYSFTSKYCLDQFTFRLLGIRPRIWKREDICNKFNLLQDKEQVIFFAEPDKHYFEACFNIITQINDQGYFASRIINIYVPGANGFPIEDSKIQKKYTQIFGEFIQSGEGNSAHVYGPFHFKLYKKANGF